METHWKQLTNPNYIGAYSLQPNERKIIIIESVSKEIVNGVDGKQEQCVVARLKNEKPFILNKTNCKTIEKVTGTPYIEHWKGVRVTIYAAKVKAYGDVVDALRIEAKAPELPELTPSNEKWDSAKTAIKAGQVTIEQIIKNYRLSVENKKGLLND